MSICDKVKRHDVWQHVKTILNSDMSNIEHEWLIDLDNPHEFCYSTDIGESVEGFKKIKHKSKSQVSIHNHPSHVIDEVGVNASTGDIRTWFHDKWYNPKMLGACVVGKPTDSPEIEMSCWPIRKNKNDYEKLEDFNDFFWYGKSGRCDIGGRFE